MKRLFTVEISGDSRVEIKNVSQSPVNVEIVRMKFWVQTTTPEGGKGTRSITEEFQVSMGLEPGEAMNLNLPFKSPQLVEIVYSMDGLIRSEAHEFNREIVDS